MSRTAQDVLEFDKLRELLRLRTTCSLGRRAIDLLEPSTDRDSLAAAFALINESQQWLRAARELGFGGVTDPQPWLAKIDGPGAVLEAKEFLAAATLLETTNWLRQQFREESQKFPLLAEKTAALSDFRELLAALRRAILPNGEISDDASTTLRRIRVSISQTRDSLQKTLKQILRSKNPDAAEDYVTLRNDRFVIPVRAENRRSIPGVAHGASATGQTVFMEPLETVEVNNQLVQLSEEEAAEIVRILRDLTERLQRMRDPLILSAETIAELDSVFSRARFAQEFDAVIPQFSQSGELRLELARHPVLEAKLRRENRAIIPMTLNLGGENNSAGQEDRVLVISGPNTGGKTVALKTTGLAALSAQSAIPVAAQSATLPLFDKILVDIGDEQSIAADLSTFSAHMVNLRTMLELATPQSLVLVDEMGTGTAPEEGAALAVALLEEFLAKKCIVLATTHHDRLKTYASTTPGIVNAAVEFDDVNLRPTYRLMVGVPGGSSGIAIARRLGIPENIIDRARALLDPKTLEAADLIAYLHRTRDELDRMQHQMADERAALESERAKLRTEWVERQKNRIKELESQFAEMQKRFDENVARVVEAVKERDVRSSLEKSARRKVQDVRGEAREAFNAAVVQTISESQKDLGVSPSSAQGFSADQLQPGAKIRVRGFSKSVILRRIEGPTAEIEAGPLRMKVAVSEITSVEFTPAGSSPYGSGATTLRGASVGTGLAPPGVNVTTKSQSPGNIPAGEINVIGMRVAEATELVDKYLDEAALAHRPRVRIIHGHGTGALRRGLAEFLKGHPLVESLASESADHGGQAITVVELRS